MGIHNWTISDGWEGIKRKCKAFPISMLLYSTWTFTFTICNFLKMKVKIKTPKEEGALKKHLSAKIAQT